MVFRTIYRRPDSVVLVERVSVETTESALKVDFPLTVRRHLPADSAPIVFTLGAVLPRLVSALQIVFGLDFGFGNHDAVASKKSVWGRRSISFRSRCFGTRAV